MDDGNTALKTLAEARNAWARLSGRPGIKITAKTEADVQAFTDLCNILGPYDRTAGRDAESMMKPLPPARRSR